MKLYSAHRRKHESEQGYALMVLLLAVALLAIAFGAAAANFKKSIQRDKEVEAIHRGVQYARAVKVFYKKFGRYPTSIDQLTNTNNLRFLRRKYSDPLSPDGKWRVLHPQDVKLAGGGGLGTLAPSSGMVNIPGVSGSGNTVLGNGGTSNFGSGFSLSGGNQKPSDQGSGSGTQSVSSQGGPGSTSQPIGGAIETTGGKDDSGSGSAFNTGQAVMGAGPVIGVASLRNEIGMHSFNQKTNYRDWQFIFNPQTDIDRQITGPYNPNAFVGKGGANPTGNSSSTSSSSTNSTPSQTTPGTSTPFSEPNPQPTRPRRDVE